MPIWHITFGDIHYSDDAWIHKVDIAVEESWKDIQTQP